MKIFKERRHALFNRPVEIAGVSYLSVGVMLYFDLTAPDDLHTEQELWKELVAVMGTDLVLDQGWPKPRAEVLLAGSAQAPGGRPTPAARVRLRCGPVDKTLHVFGDRFWERGNDGVLRLTEAKPFTSMPLDWKHAFGGPDFKDNPLGKGIAPLTRPDGTQVVPLPNVEGESLIGAPTDQPVPASFGPLDMLWPARARKNGTYDDAWLKQRWPALPDDMNYEFFCMAPEDQYLPGHFEGNEVIEIEGMHKDLPVISSRLPHRRVRAFVTRRDKEEPENIEKAVFEELGLKPETLWLFPGILRGVVLFRGLVRCADDEYSDLARLYVADEALASEPKAIEFYRDDQLKKANLGVPFDPAMQQNFQQKMAEAAKIFLNLPKELKQRAETARGETPPMIVGPADMARKMEASLAKIRAAIDKVETSTQNLHQRFGHHVAIDLGVFGRARAQADAMEAKMREMQARAENILAQKNELLDHSKEIVKRPQMKPLLVKKGVSDPEQLFTGTPPGPPFHVRGFPLVTSWRFGLSLDDARLHGLRDLGLNRRTTENRWLGWNPEPRQERFEDWGLDPKPGQETFTLPAGLVLPRFQGRHLNRILVRPGGLDDAASDVLVPGSLDEPLFLEAASEQGVVALVPDELSAAYVEQEAGDFAHVAVCAAPAGPLPKEAAEALKKGALAVVLLPEKSAWAAQETEFSAALPGCRFARLPEVAGVFAAHAKHLDVRQAIVEQLPPAQAQAHSLLFDAPGAPKKAGAKTLKDICAPAAMADMIKQNTQDILGAKKAEFQQRAAPLLKKAEDAKTRMTQAGFDIPEAPPPAKPRPMDVELNERADQVQAIRDKMKAMDSLTPEAEAKFNENIAKLRALGPRLEAQKTEGMARLKAFELPPEHAQAMAKAGLDPAKLRPQPPEMVLAAAKGQGDMRGATIKDLDFTGQDLSGIDLTQARVSKCVFKNAKLKGARFDQTIVKECDFTGADLSEAVFERPVFKECVLDKASLRRARGQMPIIQKSGLRQTDFSESDFTQLVVQQSAMDGLILNQGRFFLCAFSEGSAVGLSADGARFEKCVFKKTALDKASFHGITTEAMLLHTCTGEKASFANSNLFKFRISHDSAFPGLNLRGVTWKQGYCRKSDLRGADFQGSELERSIFDSCNLTSANLAKVKLRRCRFPKTDLEGAVLHFADLFMASLRKTRLVQADLRGANCYAVDFFKAVLGETRMEGANLKRSLLDGREETLRQEGMIL